MTTRTGKLDLSPSNRKATWTDGTLPLHKTMILAPDPNRELTPNGFLVEQPAATTVRSHFHTNSQWQVFVGGSGTLGRKPVQGFVAQYIAPHTAYGPIVADGHGLWYLTLRPSAASGAKYLPQARGQLDMKLAKRQITSEVHLPTAVGPERQVVEMVQPQPDGTAAWMVYVGPDETVDAPIHAGGLARYYVVARGELIVNGDHLGPLSLAWVDEDDMSMALRSGPQGMTVLVLQFPGNAY